MNIATLKAEDIVSAWLQVPKNRNEIITIAYDKPIFDFIVATCECHHLEGYPNVYNVNGIYQKIICKSGN